MAAWSMLGFAQPAVAADQQGRYSVRGVGALRCADVVRLVDEQRPEVAQVVAWADGALTVMNRNERETYDLLPFAVPAGLFATMVVNLCRQAPTLLFDTAVRQIGETLRPLRLRREEAPVAVSVGENRAEIRPQTIRLVQERLKQLNLFAGNPDGRWGAPTQAALKRFQESRDLPVTEIPDARTVFSLLLQAR
jgi:hypothetical protein